MDEYEHLYETHFQSHVTHIYVIQLKSVLEIMCYENYSIKKKNYQPSMKGGKASTLI